MIYKCSYRYALFFFVYQPKFKTRIAFIEEVIAQTDIFLLFRDDFFLNYRLSLKRSRFQDDCISLKIRFIFIFCIL